MKSTGSIRQTLTAVTAALVGATPAGASGVNHSETSLLLYNERDRVHATEAIFSLDKQLKNEYRFNMRLTYDGLTGASPTGGSPAKNAQTITRPSGGARTVVPAGAIPIDKSFAETRFALDLGLGRKLSSVTTANAGAHISSEHDYTSLGLNGGISYDFNQARNSIGLSASINRDVVKPLLGVPTPYVSVNEDAEIIDHQRITNGNRKKYVYDVVVSFTQVVDPKTLLRLSYSLDYATGYLTDPYKIFSVVQPNDSVNAGDPVDQLHENRPGKRVGNAASADIRKYVWGTIVETGYRYFFDDWGVKSHTVDLSVKADLKKIGSFEPHVRYYTQGRADFSRPFLVQGTSVPDYVSADSRLAAFSAITYGMAWTIPTSATSRLTFAADIYTQRGDASPPEAFGPLKDITMFPDLRAVMLRVGLAHDF
ncbi:MAG: DUF3570 domain-containing protein [Candidatus Zixiibacteriota bacterium]